MRLAPWLRDLASGRARPRPHTPPRPRLAVEPLEDRNVPSGSGFILGPLVQVSGKVDVLTDHSDLEGQRGTVYLNSEVEPQIAVDPTNLNHVVAVWQQDRWSNGGARGVVPAV